MGQRLNPFGVLQVVHLVSQDLSIAGKRAGLAGARSGLFMEQLRIVKEMREADERNGRTGDMVRPRYLVWENVVGAFSSNKGKDFAAVLEEIARIAEPGFSLSGLPEKWKWTKAGAIDGDGWSIAWRTHDAKDWGKTIRDSRTGNVIRLGTPQRRRRISVVADFGGDTASEIQFDSESVSGDIAESGASGERLAEAAESGFNPAVRDVTTYCLQGNGIDRADTAGCNGKGWREDACYTLNTIDRPAVVAPAVALDMTHACDVIRECGEQVPALQARMGTGGNQVPLTYGTHNACSMLYAAAWRAARAMGYKRLVTYILDSESGTSLKASGWKCVGQAGGLRWTGKRRPEVDLYPAQMKIRWEKEEHDGSVDYVQQGNHA